MSKKKDGKSGSYRFWLDLSRDHFRFFRSIEEQVPKVLMSLKDKVLPLYAATLEGMPEGAMKVIRDPETGEVAYWSAIWDWAQEYALVEAKDVPTLKDYRNWGIAHSIDRLIAGYEDIWFRESPFQPDSSVVLFALNTLERVVGRTLVNWCKSTDLSKLTWTLPDLAAESSTVYDRDDFESYAEARQLVMEVPMFRRWVEEGHVFDHEVPFDPPPYLYTFKVPAWNMRKEERADAIKRILKDCKKQLQQQMAFHEGVAEAFGLEKHTRIINKKHCDWLAKYQCGKQTKYEIAKEIADRSSKFQVVETSDKNAAIKKQQNANLIAKAEKMVSKGIANAAKRVIGTAWESWLRG